MSSIELLQAVAVTAELCGRTFSEAAARVFVSDLAIYPEAAVIKALARCRREVKGVLTISEVVARIDDGRPGPDEAWAMMPFDEMRTVVWTDEMAQAFGVARHLLAINDKAGGRIAFKEAYVKAVADARDAGTAPLWTPSLGHDKDGRDAALHEAVSKGRMSLDHAQSFVPALAAPAARMAALALSAIRAPRSAAVVRARACEGVPA